MLYKNKKNVLRGVVAFVFMLTLSLSTALSPLAKAEEARYTWKTLTSAPNFSFTDLRGSYVSPDGSKLFVMDSDAAHNSNFWMSADDGATWRKIFSKQGVINDVSISADGSKIVLGYGYSFSISTDGGQSWVERGPYSGRGNVLISPDGSFLASCSGSRATGLITHISTDDGQTWTQKGANTIGCPYYIFNNGTMIAAAYNDMAKSTDYGQTWTEFPNSINISELASFSNNGNNIFEGDRISLDGGNHWTPSNAPIPAGRFVGKANISDDGKKLFVSTAPTGYSPKLMTLLTSIDGGKTWSSEDVSEDGLLIEVSSDGSKVFYVYDDNNGRSVYRVGTLPTSQPVTPGSGAGGAATPSVSTSATPGQKPGKASGRLAETGISVQLIGGLAVVAVAAGALVLRKRL